MDAWYADLVADPGKAIELLTTDYAPLAPFLASLHATVPDVGGGIGFVRQYLRSDARYVVIDPSLQWLASEWEQLSGTFPQLNRPPLFVRRRAQPGEPAQQGTDAGIRDETRQPDVAPARSIELEARIEAATLRAERAIEDVVDRDQRLRECQAELAAVKKERDQQLSELRARLQAVYDSKIWRVTTRYWKLRDRLRL